jgi:hypothetical protein
MMPAGPGPDIKLAENKWTIGMTNDTVDGDKMLRTVKGCVRGCCPPLSASERETLSVSGGGLTPLRSHPAPRG